MQWICIWQICGNLSKNHFVAREQMDNGHKPFSKYLIVVCHLSFFSISFLSTDHWYKFLIQKCMIWCMLMVTTHISTFVIVGFCWTSNVSYCTMIYFSRGKSYGRQNMLHHHILYYLLRWHCYKRIVTLFYWIAWISPTSSNFSMVRMQKGKLLFWFFSLENRFSSVS